MRRVERSRRIAREEGSFLRIAALLVGQEMTQTARRSELRV